MFGVAFINGVSNASHIEIQAQTKKISNNFQFSTFRSVDVFKRICRTHNSQWKIRSYLSKMQFLKKFSVFRFQNKSPVNAQPPVKGSVTLDSDISGIECKFLMLKHSQNFDRS